jgi:serine/threonine protein kinase
MQNKQVNVLRRIVGGFDLVSVKSYYPSGLPQEHAVWILDRLLSVLGFMHINGVLHGSIEPSNIMIVPSNHNGLLLDMLLSVSRANEAGATYRGINQYTAPEIISKTLLTPHPSSDMYSLGKTMLYLLGGDLNTKALPVGIDPRIKSFLDKFLDPDPYRRASDAWQSWHQLHHLREQVFGAANQFLTLKIG